MEGAHRLALALQVATLELKLYNLIQALERHYAPDQPRVPAGNPDGGQWTDGSAGSPSIGRSDLRRRPTAVEVAQLANFSKHAIDQAINRSVGPAAILDAIKNPIKIRGPRSDGTTQFIGRGAAVVFNDEGLIVTVWSK